MSALSLMGIGAAGVASAANTPDVAASEAKARIIFVVCFIKKEKGNESN